MTVERESDGYGMCDMCGKISPPNLELHVPLCIEVQELQAAVAELRARLDQELGRETVPAPVEDVPFRTTQPTLPDGEVRK